jgi:hypothetical protein
MGGSSGAVGRGSLRWERSIAPSRSSKASNKGGGVDILHKWAEGIADALSCGLGTSVDWGIVVNGENGDRRYTFLGEAKGGLSWKRAVAVDAGVEAGGVHVDAFHHEAGSLIVSDSQGVTSAGKTAVNEWWVDTGSIHARGDGRKVNIDTIAHWENASAIGRVNELLS